MASHFNLIHTEYTIYRNIDLKLKLNPSVYNNHVMIYRENMYTWNNSGH